MMGKMFIINSGTTFTAVWSIVKGWIDEKTRNKIEVLGASYMTKLEAFVDVSQIPDFMGDKKLKGTLKSDFLTD